ncbi:hypothetical protein ACVW19_002468 [Streptomyces sp. TE5632]
MRKHYDDDRGALVGLVGLVALINAASRLAVVVRRRGGSSGPGTFAAAVDT